MNEQQQAAGILGIGSCLPDKVLTNFDLEKIVDTSDEWIKKRTGISERRILESDEPAYMMGVEASKRALKDAGISPEQIDLILVTTNTPDYLVPSTACLIQRHIGARNAAAFDLNAACSGLIYGLTIAQQFILTGYYRHILLIGCEALSKVTDWEDRNTCVLFADGAGAVVLGPVEAEYGIRSTYVKADGEAGKVITLPCCSISQEDLEIRKHESKRVVWMEGGEVFKFALRVMSEATEKVVEEAGLTMEDVKLIVPHQANIRIIDGAIRKLKVSPEKVFTNLHKYGNMSSASIAVALDEAVKEGRLEKGDPVVLVGFGGGLTWGAALIRWSR